jgi:hypothetical protein
MNALNGIISDYNTIIQYYFNINNINRCPNFLKKNNVTYKYIISEQIIRGDRKNIFINLLKTDSTKKDSKNDYFRSLYINDKNIILILNSLKTAIDNLITNLYSDGYILDNISKENIILKEIYKINTEEKDTKVYFYDYSKLKISNNENKNNDINALCTFIKWLFDNFGFVDTLELVKKLDHNKINSPHDLSIQLDLIIKAIPGTPFSKLFRKSINNNNIKEILKSLKEGIEKLITNLYNTNYIIKDINKDNITLNLNNNIYFINFKNLSIRDNTNINDDIKALIEFIKWLFSADPSKTTNEYSELNYNFKFGYGTEHFSDRDSFKNAYDLVEKLDYKNINNPTSLCKKLDEIINAIPAPS